MLMPFAGSAAGLAAGGVFTLLLGYACVSDLRTRRIPNRLVLTLLLTGLAFAILSRPALPAVLAAVSGFALGLAIWLPFYLLRMLGAGDVKLFAAAATWLGPMQTVHAAILAALAGGVLALLYLLWTRMIKDALTGMVGWAIAVRYAGWRNPVPATQARHQLPYGVALAAGAALTAWFPGWTLLAIKP
jgi:prepilin peptidase CpaA